MLLLLAVVAGANAGAQSNQLPVRLALIAEDASSATAADLLTVELSKSPTIRLLERAEIGRILREQSLSAANTGYVKLGQILGADGLLLLEPSKDGTNQFLSARLVAVKPGVVIGNVRTPWPVPDVAQWAKWIPARFGPLFPKLGVIAKDAVPISVVNLRAAVGTAQSQELEQQLTALAIERLTQQRELFVLERQRMDLLNDEKEFKGVPESAFWDGSYLLDGTIDRDGYSPDSVTINARLTPPKRGVPVNFEIKGSRTNLTDVVNQLASRVVPEMKLEAAGTTWNPAEEADQYFQEAQWAFKWNMINEAQTAIETSWSLGKRTKEVAEFRIRIYGREGAPAHSDFLSMNPTDPGFAPDLNNLKPAIHALQLYQQGFRDFCGNDSRPDEAWHTDSRWLLGSTSELLTRCQYFPDAWRGREEDVAELRRVARETLGMIYEHPAYRNSYLEKAGIQLALGAAWQDTPEQYFDLCREYARSNILCQLIEQVAVLPRVGWTVQDQSRAAVLRREFIEELRASTNGLTKVVGCYLAFLGEKPDPEYRDRAFELFDVVVANSHALMAGGLDGRVLQLIENEVKGPPNGVFVSAIQQQVYKRYWDEVRCDVAGNALVGFLEKDNQFKPDDFERYSYFMRSIGDTFLRSQVRVMKVLTAMDGYKARIVEKQTEHPFAYNFTSFFEPYQDWLRRALPPEPAALNAAAKTPTAPAATPPQIRNVPPNSIAPAALKAAPTDVVQVTHFWNLPATSTFDYGNMFSGLQITGGKFREGRFWIEVFNGDNRYEARAAFIYGVNLTNLQTEVIKMPHGADEGPRKFGNSFEVCGNYVYLNGPEKLCRYSLQTKAWEDLPVSAVGYPRLRVVGERLFLITAITFEELKADGKELVLLASTRRRPPVNVLDALPDFYSGNLASAGLYGDDPDIFPGPEGTIRVFVKGKIYSQDGNNWIETGALPASADPRWGTRDFGDDLMVSFVGEQKRLLYLMYHDQPSMALALIIPNVNPYRVPTGIPEPRLPDPLWQPPSQIALDKFSPAMEGDKLWFLSGDVSVKGTPNRGAQINEHDGRHALLLEFKRNQPQPRQIPLWFEVKEGMLSAEWWGAFRHYNPADAVPLNLAVFEPTPAGIVIGYDNVPGLWLVSRSDLDGTSRNLDPNTSLIAAAEAGDVSATRDALAHGASVDTRNYRGWTPLIIAAKAGNLELARLLIEKGADAEAKSIAATGSTVLDFAADGNNPDLIKELVQHGAAVNGPGANGLTPLYFAAVNHRLVAAETLLALGANVERLGPENERGLRFTPLMGAACQGDAEMVELLLAKGARMEKTNPTGDTALTLVVRTPHPDVVKLLLAKGADVNALNSTGQTALILAAYNGDLENIKVLLAAGADPLAVAKAAGDNTRNVDAATAARERDHPEAMALILQAQEQARAAKK